MAEVVSFEQQGFPGSFRQRVREAVPEVQSGLVAAAFAEIPVRVPGDASLIKGHRLDSQFRGLNELVEATAGDWITARVDDYCGLQEVRRRDPPDRRLLDG